jgi:hypothetical protein
MKVDNSTARASRWYDAHPWVKHWKNAKRRCEDPAHKSYACYGGRGVRFLLTKGEARHLWERNGAADLRRPSLDRRDSALDYTRDNCEFVELTDNCSRPRIRWNGAGA